MLKQVVSVMVDIDLKNADARDMLKNILDFCFMLEQLASNFRITNTKMLT